jgi:hypothetical protein
MHLNIIADKVEVFRNHNVDDITARKVSKREWPLAVVIKALV